MGQRLLLDSHVGVEVDLGGFRRFVAEPKGDDTEVYPSPQEVHGGCMAEGVWGHLLPQKRGTCQAPSRRVTGDQALQGIGTEPPTPGARKDRIRRIPF